MKLTKPKKNKKEQNKEAKADKTMAEEDQKAPVPLVSYVNNSLHSIFLAKLNCTSTISKISTLMDCMRTNVAFPTTFRGFALNTRELCTARCTTKKIFLKNLNFRKSFCLELLLKENENDHQTRWLHVVW